MGKSSHLGAKYIFFLLPFIYFFFFGDVLVYVIGAATLVLSCLFPTTLHGSPEGVVDLPAGCTNAKEQEGDAHPQLWSLSESQAPSESAFC